MPYPDLEAEITNDPLTRGYASMTDVEVRDDLQTEYRTVKDPVGREEVRKWAVSQEVWVELERAAKDTNVAKGAQNAAKGAATILLDGTVSVDMEDAEIQAMMSSLVDANNVTFTRADIDALHTRAERTVSRAEELRRNGKRLPRPIRTQHITDARS